MTDQDHDRKFVELAFGASLSLMALLIAVAAILSTKWDDVKDLADLSVWFEILLWGTAACAILAGATSGACLARLRGSSVPASAVSCMLWAVIIIVMAGVPVFVWATTR